MSRNFYGKSQGLRRVVCIGRKCFVCTLSGLMLVGSLGGNAVKAASDLQGVCGQGELCAEEICGNGESCDAGVAPEAEGILQDSEDVEVLTTDLENDIDSIIEQIHWRSDWTSIIKSDKAAWDALKNATPKRTVYYELWKDGELYEEIANYSLFLSGEYTYMGDEIWYVLRADPQDYIAKESGKYKYRIRIEATVDGVKQTAYSPFSEEKEYVRPSAQLASTKGHWDESRNGVLIFPSVPDCHGYEFTLYATSNKNDEPSACRKTSIFYSCVTMDPGISSINVEDVLIWTSGGFDDLLTGYYAVSIRGLTKNIEEVRMADEVPLSNYMYINNDGTFRDVGPDDWFMNAVEYAADHSIMSGKENRRFAPMDRITRAEFATVLYNMVDRPETEFSETFRDVKAGKWYTNPVLWAFDNGIAAGYPNGKFGVSDYITREQLAKMLYEFASLQGYDMDYDMDVLERFGDTELINSWAQQSLSWAVTKGVMSGSGGENPKLNPKGFATRAECASMIKNMQTKLGGVE